MGFASLGAVSRGPGLLGQRELPDGARGADLAAERATRLAVSDARHQHRRPDTLHARPARGSGCRALFGQTFMHSPQRTQRSRKLFSSSAPGGRMSRSSGFDRQARRRCAAAATAAAPAASLASALRRCRSGPSMVASRAGKNLKRSPLSGQSSTQFRQRWHSALRHLAPGIGSSPPWQCSRQRLQSSQLRGVLLQAQNRPARHPAQQRAQRAQRPAPEARDAQVQRQDRDEEQPQEEALAEIRLLEAQHHLAQQEVRSTSASDAQDAGAALVQGVQTAHSERS